MVGAPGLLLALLFVVFVRDYRTPPLFGGGARSPRSLRTLVAALFRPRCMLAACVGAGLQLVTVSTIYAWLPTYLNRDYGFAPDVAGARAGFVVLAGGVGAVAWSIVADRWTARTRRARLYVPVAVALATAAVMPLAFGLIAPGPLQFALILIGATTMTGTLGPIAAVVVDVAHPGLRATAAAVLALVGHLVGLTTGPLVTGWLSDTHGLGFALTVVPMFCLAAAALFAFAAQRYEADLAATPSAPDLVDDVPRVGAA
jgi:predicted MFS family arabinose efflux permease